MASRDIRSIFPLEVWKMIARDCTTDAFIEMNKGIPEIQMFLVRTIGTEMLFEKVFPILYKGEYIDSEDAKQARLVCQRWSSVIDNYFATNDFDSYWNYQTEEVDTFGIVLWLPLRTKDVQRLEMMSKNPRCPSPARKLVLKYPYLLRRDSLDIDSFTKEINRHAELWKTFKHVVIEEDLTFLVDLVAQDAEISEGEEEGAEENMNNVADEDLWDEDVCDEDMGWFLPFFENMTNLESIDGDCVLEKITDNLVEMPHINKLKMITRDCAYGHEWNHYQLLEKCSNNLEVLRLTGWKSSKRTLVDLTLPKLRELEVYEREWIQNNGPSDMIALFSRRNSMPSLKRLLLPEGDEDFVEEMKQLLRNFNKNLSQILFLRDSPDCRIVGVNISFA